MNCACGFWHAVFLHARVAEGRFQVEFESVDWGKAFEKLQKDCAAVESALGLDLRFKPPHQDDHRLRMLYVGCCGSSRF